MALKFTPTAGRIRPTMGRFPLTQHWRLDGISNSKSVLIRYDGVEYFDYMWLATFSKQPLLTKYKLPQVSYKHNQPYMQWKSHS